MEVNEKEARELAAQIEREAPGTTVTIEPDEIVPWCAEYHLALCKPDVIRFVVRSVEQWNERKHLISKWQSHQVE